MANFNPCRDHCYTRYNKQYSDDCIDTCDYAKAVIDLKKLKDKYDRLNKRYKELRGMIEADDGK